MTGAQRLTIAATLLAGAAFYHADAAPARMSRDRSYHENWFIDAGLDAAVINSSALSWHAATKPGLRGSFELSSLNIASAGFDVTRAEFLLNASAPVSNASITLLMWNQIATSNLLVTAYVCAGAGGGAFSEEQATHFQTSVSGGVQVVNLDFQEQPLRAAFKRVTHWAVSVDCGPNVSCYVASTTARPTSEEDFGIEAVDTVWLPVPLPSTVASPSQTTSCWGALSNRHPLVSFAGYVDSCPGATWRGLTSVFNRNGLTWFDTQIRYNPVVCRRIELDAVALALLTLYCLTFFGFVLQMAYTACVWAMGQLGCNCVCQCRCYCELDSNKPPGDGLIHAPSANHTGVSKSQSEPDPKGPKCKQCEHTVKLKPTQCRFCHPPQVNEEEARRRRWKRIQQGITFVAGMIEQITFSFWYLANGECGL